MRSVAAGAEGAVAGATARGREEGAWRGGLGVAAW